MLHAAAMLAGLFLISLLLTQGWETRDGAVLAFAAALVSTAIAMQFGGVRKNPFSAAPQYLALLASRTGAVLRGALSTIRAALAADVTLRPALVRVRTETGGLAAAAAADAIGAAPGHVVVEADGEGMLVHVMHEDDAESGVFGKVNRAAAQILGRAS